MEHSPNIPEADGFEGHSTATGGPGGRGHDEGLLFVGDRGRLPLEARRALVLLLKLTHLSVLRHPQEWRALMDHRAGIEEVLNELLLVLEVDEQAGVAWKAQASAEDEQVFNTLLRNRSVPPTQMRIMLMLRELAALARQRGEASAVVRGGDLLDELALHYPAERGDHAAQRRADATHLRALVADDLLLAPHGQADAEVEDVVYTVSWVVESLLTPDRITAYQQAVAESLETMAAGGLLTDELDDVDDELQGPGEGQDALLGDGQTLDPDEMTTGVAGEMTTGVAGEMTTGVAGEEEL